MKETKMRKGYSVYIASALVLATSLFACDTALAVTTDQEMPDALARALDDHLKNNPTISGEAITVMTPSASWTVARGKVVGSNKPLTSRHVFRIASVTKPYTAAAILRLMEMGRLEISTPITPLISTDSAQRLRKGGYDPDKITIRQLMSHTSGLYDYANDAGFMQAVQENPLREWTRAEQIQMAMDNGQPIGKPGEAYGYSDTGYILLGEIIERQSGQNLGAAVRQLLDFKRLGLNDTYWEGYELPISKMPFAGAAFETTDMTQVNHSYDRFGGGGLISSTHDLARFYKALVKGEVFKQRRTLAVLLSVPEKGHSMSDQHIQGNGLVNTQIGRANCFGHSGFWGQYVAYCPEYDVTVAWTRNDSINPAPGMSMRSRLADILDIE
jgi:D-alanyl-D-alanine carboxypeptidase